MKFKLFMLTDWYPTWKCSLLNRKEKKIDGKNNETDHEHRTESRAAWRKKYWNLRNWLSPHLFFIFLMKSWGNYEPSPVELIVDFDWLVSEHFDPVPQAWSDLFVLYGTELTE